MFRWLAGSSPRPAYDHPDAVELNDQVQQEYVERVRRTRDATPHGPGRLRAADRRVPAGLPDGEPVATGGWRPRTTTPEGYSDGDAELKRMYVVPEARGRGLARRILAGLEADAAAAGRLPHGAGDRRPSSPRR